MEKTSRVLFILFIILISLNSNVLSSSLVFAQSDYWVELSADVTEGTSPLFVTFTCDVYNAHLAGGVMAYMWDFDGDGYSDASSSRASISNVYYPRSVDTAYNAKVKVRFDNDETRDATVSINVNAVNSTDWLKIMTIGSFTTFGFSVDGRIYVFDQRKWNVYNLEVNGEIMSFPSIRNIGSRNAILTYLTEYGKVEMFIEYGLTDIIRLTVSVYDSNDEKISPELVQLIHLDGNMENRIIFVVDDPYAGLESFELNLNPGWNMVSLPINPIDPSASTVLKDLDYYQLFSWSSSGYITADSFEVGRGYWLFTSDNKSITVMGEVVDETNVILEPGFNLIGGLNSVVASNTLFPNYHMLIYWNQSFYTESYYLEPGKGYWVLVLEETIVTLN